MATDRIIIPNSEPTACPACGDTNIKWEYTPDEWDGDSYGDCQNEDCFAVLVSGRFGVTVAPSC